MEKLKLNPTAGDDNFWTRQQSLLDRTREGTRTPDFVRPALVTKEVSDALEAVIKYDWNSELEDFLCRGERGEPLQSHIFVSKLMLREWLNSQSGPWIPTELAARVIFLVASAALFLFFLPEIVELLVHRF